MNDDPYEYELDRRRQEKKDVGEAFAILKRAIEKDPAYAYGWHANIAMSLYDSMPEIFWMHDKTHWHDITNQAATTFMARAFEVDTSNDMLTKTDPERFPKRSK